MNRKLKYRVLVTETWPHTIWESKDIDCIDFKANKIFIDGNFCWRLDKTIFMQSTEIEDKNGVEIYEGDILKVGFEMYLSNRYLYTKGYVEYFDGRWLLCSTLAIPRNCEELTTPIEREVIGNIYQNPELLKGN